MVRSGALKSSLRKSVQMGLVRRRAPTTNEGGAELCLQVPSRPLILELALLEVFQSIYF